MKARLIRSSGGTLTVELVIGAITDATAVLYVGGQGTFAVIRDEPWPTGQLLTLRAYPDALMRLRACLLATSAALSSFRAIRAASLTGAAQSAALVTVLQPAPVRLRSSGPKGEWRESVWSRASSAASWATERLS